MKNKMLSVIGILIILQAGVASAGITPRSNYARPYEPMTRPAYFVLPPGAVEPEGWLRDWCLAARDGFTGHMDEYHEAFRQAWAADYKMTGERLNWPMGAWPYEGGGYWFDGLARLGYALHDDALIGQAKTRLGVVADNMNTNSVLFLWWLDRNNIHDVSSAKTAGNGWSLWASGLLGRALAGAYAGSGDPRLLGTLETAYSGAGEWLQLGWSLSNPWPAFDTWTWTGNKEIAGALDALFPPDGDKSPKRPTNGYRRAPGAQTFGEHRDHIVHFIEGSTPWALGYLWTGNRDYLDAALDWHDLLARDCMQPSGVPVADEWSGPPGAFRGTETCDIAGYLWSQTALLAVSGQGRLADRAERAFFNAGPIAVSRDFKTHVYFQCPNRIVDQSPAHKEGPKAMGNSYQRTHCILCCTASLNRILPYYVTHMWMATQENGLVATYYGPCKVTALAADRVPVEITCRTDYPFNETVDMDVKPVREAVFPLSFRIPGWCKSPAMTVNGICVTAAPDTNGFVRVERLWKPGDSVRLHFPMSASVQTGRDVNADGAPYATVSYGPLLFALPIPDTKDENTPDPSAKWRYALDAQEPKLTVERTRMPAKWDWPLAAPLKLQANAVAIEWNPSAEKPRLPSAPADARQPVERITLIPYGCSKFRISMFPVTAPAGK